MKTEEKLLIIKRLRSTGILNKNGLHMFKLFCRKKRFKLQQVARMFNVTLRTVKRWFNASEIRLSVASRNKMATLLGEELNNERATGMHNLSAVSEDVVSYIKPSNLADFFSCTRKIHEIIEGRSSVLGACFLGRIYAIALMEYKSFIPQKN